MAYRQPTHHHAPQRYIEPEETHLGTNGPELSEPLDESQYRIVFLPGTSSATDRTLTTSTLHTRQTAGRSRISDYGSLDTAARSSGFEEGSEHTEAILEDEEDGELDSLDSHLHEFRAEPNVLRDSTIEDVRVSSNPVLPTHDGLGLFRFDEAALGDGVQEHIYAFEKYNPRRIKRRRESLELGQLSLENDRSVEHERIRRIEEWRLEQSRALLEEIHKETRRSKNFLSQGPKSTILDWKDDEAATMGSVTEGDSEPREPQFQLPVGDDESFWSRITKRVIRDLMGIDDHLLSILFGEALPKDDDQSSTPLIDQSLRAAMARTSTDIDSWESRLLQRIARELGLLVHQLSDHPGAFSTYLKLQQTPLPYAGLPIIPEITQDPSQDVNPSTLAGSVPEFRPTIQPSTQPINIPNATSRTTHIDTMIIDDIDATPKPEYPLQQNLQSQDSSIEFSKEEWEKQLDIKMVFRYLISRFSSRPTSHTSLTRETSHLATSSPQDAAARVARVRQHHPLVRGQKPAERRTFKVIVPNSPILHRRGSSCASQSTRKSARRNSGSSRHYWDINGSIGSGSLVASAGGWGEV